MHHGPNTNHGLIKMGGPVGRLVSFNVHVSVVVASDGDVTELLASLDCAAFD